MKSKSKRENQTNGLTTGIVVRWTTELVLIIGEGKY